MLTNEPQPDIAVTDAGDPDGWVIVRASGELDLATAPRLREHVTDLAVTRRSPRVILDLAGLRFCDSTGLGTLFALHSRLHSATGALVLAGLDGQPLELLTRTGLDRRFTLVPDVSAAITNPA